MPRILEIELERLKREVSLVRLVEARGIELKKHGGADLVGRCPFHEDRTPSLVVSPKKNLWHCLGACQTGGSVVDWVMKSKGVSFMHAVELLRADVGLEGPVPVGRKGNKTVQASTVRVLEAPVAADAADAKVLGDVARYYHETLKSSTEALAYLAGRGLTHPELVERFQLGYANRTLGYRLPEKNRVAGRDLRGTLARLGILRDSGHEHFRGSLVVPIFDEAGQVVEMYGRKIHDNLRAGTPMHLYLPGAHRGLWNASALAAGEDVILCEAILDAMTFWCAGYRNVTASYGVEGFTPDHLTAFQRAGTKRVLIAYDRDDAGEKAAERLAAQLAGEGLTAFRIHFPAGQDANAHVAKLAPKDQQLLLGQVIRRAHWLAGADRSLAVPPPPSPAPVAQAARPSSPAFPLQPAPATTKPEPPTATPSPPVMPGKPAPATAIERPPEKKETPSLAVETVRPPAPPPVEPGGALPHPPGALAETTEHEVVFHLGDRRIRVRGLDRNRSYDQLKVNVLMGRGEAFHVDTVDLYSARHRQAYLEQAAAELGVRVEVVKRDLGQVLLELEGLQERALAAQVAPKDAGPQMSEEERGEAMGLLTDPRLMDRILEDFARAGVVGEETNKLVGYLGAVSRKLEHPLAVLVQSSSAAGKSSLMKSVLAFVPEEERLEYSAMTGQSLYYLGETELRHKVLAVTEEEGAERASYALKLLQSEGQLTIASTGKDGETGKLVTHEYHVEGPVMIFMTTTAIEIDEELLNRCLVLTVDEGAAQTAAIHELQRESRTLAGLLGKKERELVLGRHRNAQRLLRTLHIVNPYAHELTFAAHKTRMRRDHMKYLTLIDAICLLHQHQREVKTAEAAVGELVEYIEVTREDIALANRLCHQVLGRTLDELPPQTRRLLGLIIELVETDRTVQGVAREHYRFSRRQLREYTGWGNTQLKLHVGRLVEMEYLAVHRAGAQLFLYELALGIADDVGAVGGEHLLPGLVDAGALGDAGTTADRSGAEGNRSGQNGHRSGDGRPPVGPRSAGGRDARNAEIPLPEANTRGIHESAAKNVHGRSANAGLNGASYPHDAVVHLAVVAAARGAADA